MKAYMLVRAVIHDREKFVNGYGAQAAKLVDKFGGKYLVRGGDINILEGKQLGSRNVVIEFESTDHAEKFYFSKDYQSIIDIRKNNSNGYIMIVKGV